MNTHHDQIIGDWECLCLGDKPLHSSSLYCYGAGDDPVLDHVTIIDVRDIVVISASPEHFLNMMLPWKISQDDGRCPKVFINGDNHQNIYYSYVPVKDEPIKVSGAFSISYTLYSVCDQLGGVSFKGVSGVFLYGKGPESFRFVTQVIVTSRDGKKHTFSLGSISPIYSSKKISLEEYLSAHNEPELRLLYTGDRILPPHGLTVIESIS
jgi:hypothetical protein